MNASERQILGVNTDQELMSIRDAVNDLLLQTGELKGQFKEHVRVEELWQEKIDNHLSQADERICSVVREAVGACRREREGMTEPAMQVAASMHDVEIADMAVRRWLNEKTKLVIVLAIFAALAVTTYFLLTSHDAEAARVTGLLALLTPFLLLLFRGR